MKTIKLILTIAAGMMLMASPACQKVEMDPGQSDNVVSETVEGVEVLFAASLEMPGAPDTKMTLAPVPGEENQVVPTWEAEDQIKIFYVNPTTSEMTSVIATATGEGTSTSFKATIPEGVEMFYAVHPATLEATVDAEGNFSVPTKVSNSDEVTFTNACISIAKCGSEKVFRFRNLCSILKFTVENPGSMMQISSLDGTPITGTVHASLNESGEVVYAAEPYTGTAYNRDFKKVPQDNYVCYIPVLPGKQESGVAINYKATYASPAVFADFSIPFERSRIYNIGTVDSHLVSDYYFTTTGAGTRSGKSWENAGDVNTFKRLVGCVEGDPSKDNAVKCARYMQIWRTKGVTFHFGAGEYVFGDENTERLTIDFYGSNGSVYSEFTIQGGYPAEGGETVSADNVTAFSGDDGKYGILNVFDRARVHINDVTFTEAKGAAANAGDDADIHTENIGAALWIKQKGTSGADKAAPRVWLTRCIFDGNKTATVSGSHKYEGGSAINIVHGAVYADKCIFKNNKDNKRNGCIKMSGANDYQSYQAYAFFNDCLFTNNTVEAEYNAQGGAVIRQNRKGGLLGMYNCVLFNNAKNGTKNNCIVLDKSAIIANCTIVDEVGENYVVRLRNDVANADAHYILANNLIMNSEGEGNRTSIAINGGSTTKNLRLYMGGGNLFGNTYGSYYTDGTHTIVTDANEYSGHQYSDIDNPSFSDNVFKWNGTLKNGTVICNYMSKEIMVEDVLQSSDINDSDENVTFSITGKNGEETYAGFYTWLDSIGAIDKDATGATRPATGWTPGAYQAQ